MKVITMLIIALVVMLCHPSFGQFHFNASAGLNYSNGSIVSINDVYLKPRLGYFVGLIPYYEISDKFQILLGVQYSLKGFNEEYELNKLKVQNKISYLDFLPEVEYRLSDMLLIGAGFYYGIKLNESFRTENGNWGKPNPTDIMKNTDIGITTKLKLEFNHLFAFVRYNIGLAHVSNIYILNENGEIQSQLSQLNRNLQLGVGYNFH